MVVGATASLPPESVPVINDVELVFQDFIREDLETSIEVVGNDVRVVAEVFASDTDALIAWSGVPLFVLREMAHKTIPMKISSTKSKEHTWTAEHPNHSFNHFHPSRPIWSRTP
jgi:midasin (ATPase involved in ribosome maturation)